MKMIAVCGLDCSLCPARLAFLNNDDALREKTAVEWSALYRAEIAPASVNCTGCREEGVKFPYCENQCFMRKCAMEKGIENCSRCSVFPCKQLDAFFLQVPEAEKNLKTLSK